MDERNISPAGDPFYSAFVGYRKSETGLLTAIREHQADLGRHMTDSELDKFAREFYAPEYRAELRRLVALGVTDEEGEEAYREAVRKDVDKAPEINGTRQT